MLIPVIIAGLALAVSGLVLIGNGVHGARLASGALAYLRVVTESDDTDHFRRRLAQPLLRRLIEPLSQKVLHRLARVTPSGYLDNVHLMLVRAGISRRVSAEEFATIQVLSVAGSIVTGLAWIPLAGVPARAAPMVLVTFAAVGLLGPRAWLRRKMQQRSDAIVRDLPDVVDLMAISVEAGLGFDQAMASACSTVASPLTEEFSLTLKEMELGLSRADALRNMKRRTDVADLSNFVLVLTQADALGMPVSRVLRAQAVELRNKRRQWARERASKLPVKIVFPLAIFIFPAILVVLLGPAMMSIMQTLR
jgi:tight adherence protein C